MNVHEVLATAALGVALGAAGLLCSGTASALPGVSYDNGSGEVGFGDHGTASGATAKASPGNTALAISILRPATARVDGAGTGNTVFAVDGTARVGHPRYPGTADNGNQVTAIGGNAWVRGDNNTVVSLAGSDVSNKSAGGDVVFGASGETVVAACGQQVPNLLSGGGNNLVVSGHVTCLP